MPPLLPVLLVALIPFLCHASPINRQVGISDNVYMTTQNGTDGFEQRVCSIDAVTYLDGETIPTSSPCEHCVCRPPGFACTITSCEYRPGCKAFRRSDQCCPEYQCECEKDGKIYQNGEKITDTNNPCEACYCQGGEIICAVIDCYWRNDCPPRYIDNRCCPMYDHCPPPSAQGPIRHRLPSLTSTLSPISWLNLTLPQSTSQAPIAETVATSASTTTTTSTTTSTTTEAPSSTTTTTTTTTEAPVVNDAENAIVSEDIVQHDVVATVPQIESLSVEPVQSNDVVESSSSSSAPVETTIGLQQEINDEPTEPIVPLNDGVAEENVPTVKPTSVAPVENLVSSTVIDSTTLFIAPALVLTIAPTQVQETLVASVPTAQPDFVAAGESNILNDDATTVASSDDAEVSNDEPVVTTNTPLIPEVQQDSVSDSVTTERLLDDATETPVAAETQDEEIIPALNDDANIQEDAATATEAVTQLNDLSVTDGPTERLNDDTSLPTDSPARIEGEIATEAPSQDEEALPATTLPPLSDLIENPDDLTRTDLRPESLASGESTTNAVPVVYSDAIEATTPSVILENELRNEEVITTVSPTNIIRNAEEDESNQVVLNDDLPATTANILQDEQELSTQNTIIQEDEPIIVHDEIQNDATVVPESDDLQKNEVVTQVVPQFDIQNDETTVQSFQQLNDDATSAPSSQLDILNDDATQPPHHDVLNVASEDVTQAPLLKELNDEAAAVTQEPQQEILHDEATDTPQHDSVIFSDDDTTTQPQQVNALNDDVTQVPQELQDDEATERSQADEASSTEPALVEKAEVASQDEPVVTEVPVKVTPSQNNQDVVDIILDDVVIPSEPEILNQVRETADTHLHSEPKPVENIPSVDAYNNEPELYHGVRNADNDTVEIVNLSAAPIEQASVQTTQQPFELNNDLEEGETVQNDEVISQTQFQLNAEATTVQNLVVLRDSPEATTSFFIERVVEHDETSQGTTEGILHEEGGIYNDEVSVTTEREFRSEILSDPHHEEGHEGHVHEETTVAPSNLERERSDLILNDEVQVTTERELRSDILSDPHHEEGHEGHVHEETTVAPSNLERERSDLILNDEVQVTTERELRSDILSDPHHEEGHVLEETTVVPSNLERERSDLILNDEEPATTSVPLYRNKVQKVAEALVDVESSAPESGENKFRLDVDVFKGSVEVSESPAEVTTGSPATDLLRSGLGSLEIVEDAPQTTLRSLEDVPALRDGLAELTTQSPSNLRADLDLIDLTTQSSSNLRADIDFDDVEVSTQKAVEALILNDDATESSPLQDEVVTTPSARMADVLYQEVVEGSGLTSSNLVQAAADELSEVTEGSGSAPILDDEPPAQTTSLPVIHDDSENELVETNKVSASEEPVTTSYAFRMDLLNSLEETDAKEPEILQKDAAAPTNSPQVAAAKDEVNELAVQDEQVTTEAVSRFRLDLDITTESPVAHSRDDVPEQSTVVSEILRAESDFVEVSTVSSSGFAAAFRDDLESDAAAVTEAIVNDAISDSSTVKPAELLRSENIEASTIRLADEEVEIANDEPVTSQAAEASVTVPSTRKDIVDTIPVIFADEPEASTGNPSERLRTETVQVEQQTEAISGSLQDAPEINDDEASSAATTIASTTNVNESDSTPKIVNKVGKEGVTLPETGVPKIQPISPDISRSNPHELRFDFQLPPEDSSWLSRAVNQFRRLSGFGSDAADASSVKPKIPSRRFLLF